VTDHRPPAGLLRLGLDRPARRAEEVGAGAPRTGARPGARTVVIAALVWIALIALPLYVDDAFAIHVLNLILLGSCFAYSWAILARAGYVSFGHNAFLGIGAFTSAYLATARHVPFWWAFLAAAAMTTLFSVALGSIILRFRGIIFVLSTFAFAQIMLRVFRLASPITGGVDGIRSIPPPVLWLVGPLQTHGQFYVLFLVYFTLVIAFTARLYGSGFGRQLEAIGENMFLSESIGIDTYRNKLAAFMISAVIAGFGGSFYAHYNLYISDTSFEMGKAIDIVVYNVVGGWGTLPGPILGALVMVPLPELLRGFVAYQVALYGLILVLILRFFRKGVWGAVRQARARRARRAAPARVEGVRLSGDRARWLAYDARIADAKAGPCLVCTGVSKSFGGLQAVTELDFSVERGTIFGIIGPNGSGKSTLYNMITGVMSPDRGTIRFDGRDITGLRPSRINRRGVARVFQSTILFRESTVRGNVVRALLGHAGFGGPRDLLGLERARDEWVEAETAEILELCGLAAVADEIPSNLPHGFQRMVALAMALVARPRLLLLDEPVTGMSVEEMGVMASALEGLRDKGLTMIVVEHNVNFVMRLCPRVLVLSYGRKITEGTPQEVKGDPEVIRSFLGG
jgi:branched-chain amino acid transport system ATP-binding protein/branched-chain amino acid transport system permease protein